MYRYRAALNIQFLVLSFSHSRFSYENPGIPLVVQRFLCPIAYHIPGTVHNSTNNDVFSVGTPPRTRCVGLSTNHSSII